MKNVVGWAAWVFCEIAFNTPDCLWWALGWTYGVGNRLYALEDRMRRGR